MWQVTEDGKAIAYFCSKSLADSFATLRHNRYGTVVGLKYVAMPYTPKPTFNLSGWVA